jgi:alkanesulfonate monooxygenase SsuD/methylene tetrahydromethanopterin reductase-like flavin-dependent oxidoreductase (luciferase family)
VASRTSRIKVGSLVTNVTLRNPSLLAKITSSVDQISGGRLIVGLGIGDRLSIPELRSYGYQFPPLDQRMALLRETIMILKAMWTQPEVSFRGKLFTLSNALCQPKPKQKSGPPIWVGGRNRNLLDITAELADGWNHWDLTQVRLRQLEAYLHTKCAEFHRPPESITESWAGTVALSPSGNLADNVKEDLKSRVGEKTRYFIASFPAGAGRKAYEGFAEAVRSLA